MHILMIAPEPFFEPRGTPFSEFHRIRALTSLGHTVDLVTYPFGRDVDLPGLRIHRCARPPFVSRVKIGPSWAKVPLNLSLTLTAVRLAMTGKYDAVHSHEEGGGIGVILAAMLRIPHLYDMHSSLPQQVKNFGVRGVPGLSHLLGWLERLMVARSRVVIVICEDLRTTVHGIRPDVPTVLIENAPGSGTMPTAGTGARIRAALGLAADAPVALYTGTFEAYQGLDLLFEAMAILVETRPDARLVLVGGDERQVATVRRQVHAAGLTPYVILTGQRPADDIPAYLDAATILVSPRSTGTNTPLKIYQYLRSGRPIVATNLRTHTQVLSPEIAFLGDATPSGYAGAMLAALSDPDRARRIGEEARRVADARYNDEAYVAKTRHALDLLFDAPASEVGRSVA
ncbi:MAG: glycosyltransferase [Acidobacteria bacterium]|nr:glycosyltransferase [Acidobacteriota bacterium]